MKKLNMILTALLPVIILMRTGKRRRQSYIVCVICDTWREFTEYSCAFPKIEMFRATDIFDLQRKYHKVVALGEDLYRLGWGELLNNAKLKLTGEVDIHELCRLEELRIERRRRYSSKGDRAMDDYVDTKETKSSNGTRCWQCGERFIPTPAQKRQWLDLETVTDPTNFVCADCQEDDEE